MAVATALYAFVGIYLSFLLAKQYVEGRWAFWATLGIWLGSSLPIYIYHGTSVLFTNGRKI